MFCVSINRCKKFISSTADGWSCNPGINGGCGHKSESTAGTAARMVKEQNPISIVPKVLRICWFIAVPGINPRVTISLAAMLLPFIQTKSAGVLQITFCRLI